MYAAVKDATHWPSALQRVCQCLGGSGFAVIVAPRDGGTLLHLAWDTGNVSRN
jgi:hypothetical protein